MTSETPRDDDILKILVATDNHLGVWENCPIRKNDSFRAFEEVFREAQARDVDMVLLGGDIFHENKPSRDTLVKAIRIFRKYVLSDRPVALRVLNNEDRPFQNANGLVNYADPNLNVGLPVFTIHGNHDDPSGEENLSALDILSADNLINYFGKTNMMGGNIGEVDVRPVLLEKGATKVALYGLGYLRDERLCRAFTTPDMVRFHRPDGGPGFEPEDFFYIFTVHQNRQKYGAKNYLPEKYIPDFMNFVLWAHEHESIPDPEPAEGAKDTVICQLGSTVATSLVDAESKPKHCLLLEIHRDSFRTTPIPLRSVRPFAYEAVTLADELELDPEDTPGLEEFLASKVEALIVKAKAKGKEQVGDDGKDMVPMVRLRVDYTGFSTINSQRFGQRFVGRVANPQDLITWAKSRVRAQKAEGRDVTQGGTGVDLISLKPEALDQATIEALVSEHLQNRLVILPEIELSMALHDYVDKDEKTALQICIDRALKETREHARKTVVADGMGVDDIVRSAVQMRGAAVAVNGRPSASARTASQAPGRALPQATAATAASVPATDGGSSDGDDLMDAADEIVAPPAKRRAGGASARGGSQAKRGRGAGRGRGRGAGGGFGARRADAAPSASATRSRRGAAEKAKARVAEIASDFESDSGDSDVDPSELEREEGAGADDDAIEILSDEEMEREERPARVGRGKNKRGRAALLDSDSDDEFAHPNSVAPSTTAAPAPAGRGGRRRLPVQLTPSQTGSHGASTFGSFR